MAEVAAGGEGKETTELNTGAMGIGKSVVPSENRTPTIAQHGYRITTAWYSVRHDVASACRKFP